MITKIIFRDQVRELLLEKMRSGNLSTGQTLSLAGLARELEVSVTPIREALTQLQTSRIIEAIPNKGFIIPELNKEEAIELYELLSTLEALAIENSTYDVTTIAKLKKQQKKFKNTNKAIDSVNEDIKFHDLLTSKYNNKTAQSILADLKMRIFFYEIAFMQLQNFQNKSSNHHDIIISHIENGQIQKAIKVLKVNWLQILDFIEL